MAKNDYFSIVYKLLSILYENLKNGENTDLEKVFNNTEAFPINKEYWIAIFEDLIEKGYIKNVAVLRISGDGKKIVPLKDGIRISADGVEYLENNSVMKKAAAVWGTVKEFLPLASVLLP